MTTTVTSFDRTIAKSIVLNWPAVQSETEEVEWLARRLAGYRRSHFKLDTEA